MKRFLIDSTQGGFVRTAMVQDGSLVELIVENDSNAPHSGDIYIARVERVLKKQYAFVDLGAEKNGFLQLSESSNIQQGQAIIVQVEKEAYAEKGCALSLVLSLAGRYATITANDPKPIGISRKITEDTRRNELLQLAKSALDGYDFSCVMRTNSDNAENSVIFKEITALCNKLQNIIQQGQYCKPPFRLYTNQAESMKLLQDCWCNGDEIIINDPEYHRDLLQTYPQAMLYNDDFPLFLNFGIESQIEKLLHPKVWLDCGGFLVFNYTEAMTVIDVNTGKLVDSKNMQKAALKTNLQAAKEIAKQLRLRNLSGIIIVDFVNMQSPDNIKQLEQVLKAELFKDRIKSLYVGMTTLGLAQITRKKQSKPLHMILAKPCNGCNGTGLVRSERYLIDLIKNRVINIFAKTIYKQAVLRTNTTLISAVKKSGVLDELQTKYNKSVIYQVIETAREDYFEVEFLVDCK